MNIDDLTIGQLKSLRGLMAAEDQLPFEVGQSYYIRTCNYHCTGRVKRIVGKFVELEDAAWVADSGRFSDAIKTGSLSEVEPLEDHTVNSEAVVDFQIWKHPLPREQI